LDCDLFQAGHHGSYTSNSEEFVAAVTPSAAVISCGKDNSYGHPHSETLQTFKKFGVEVFRTDLMGDILFVSDGETITPCR
jgi:competence protein ComEC